MALFNRPFDRNRDGKMSRKERAMEIEFLKSLEEKREDHQNKPYQLDDLKNKE